MKPMNERPIRKQLYTAIATALALGASVVMSSHAQEGETDPVPGLDVDIVLVETPGGDELPGDVPEVGELPEELEPLPTLPEGIALDANGDPYPAGGPPGLYTAITDKEQKLGMVGVYDAEGNLVDVTYEGGNSGQQNALSRLRANLERKLKKLVSFDETPEVPDTGDLDDTPVVEELAVSAELGISKQSVKVSKARIDKSQKLEKAVKLEKVTKVERVEKTAKPTRVERLERPQKPTKVTRVERPQRPEKIARVEKPQRPEKISRVEKPQRPEKPQKPEKPERPGRS
jgi:hypothetical protein